MGGSSTALAVVVIVGSALADVAWAEEATPRPGADRLSALVREEIQAHENEQHSDFRVYWKSGLNLETHDGNFALKMGGRIHADSTWFDDYDKNLGAAVGGEWHSGFEFRRAHLYVSGTLYELVAFKAEYDFAGGDADFNDLWIGLHGGDKCLGCMFPNITVGHFKEYFSLEEMTTGNYRTFLELASPVETFAPGRSVGIGLTRDLLSERATAALGIFGDADEYGNGSWTEGGYHVTGRTTFLPWAPCDCASRFWEVGAAASYQGDLRELRYSSRPEVHLGPRIIDTGPFEADSAWLVGIETAFQYDRWHFQSEFLSAIVNSTAADDPTYFGWYAEASYMLLGGTRSFKRSAASFDRVRPCTSLLGEDCRGSGGLELAVRYSTTDLDDGNVQGGLLNDVTVGLNWYMSPNSVIRLNCVFADVENAHGAGSPAGDGNLNAFGIRFQVDW